MILKIEVLIALEWFTVEFESESIIRNKIISIKHEGFLLDLNKLPLTHPEHYEKIESEVTKEAEKYWNKSGGCKGLTGVPTLDAYLNKYMGLCVILMVVSFSGFSQAYLDFGGGLGKDHIAGLIPAMKISVGYQFQNNIVAEGIIQPSITRKVNAPNYFGVKAGYNFNGFIPSIGALYNYRNSDDVSMNRWEVGYALKYQFPLNENGGLFAEALYTKSSYQLMAGFNIQF